MSFSIQTNVNSLIAQENLRVNSNFQSMTIQRLTSGYRINSSADDAAGLAIANKFRSDTAELSQGVRNANDGISTLQIIDGGMNNISKMLDRLRTLATQSASDTFTGERTTVNSEFQSLLSEIDRQAQSIGLSQGGQFAKSLSVFIGGGKTAGGALSTSNGTVSMDLTNSAVDTKSLGLSGMQAVAGSADLSVTSATSVSNIVNDATNKASESTPGSTVFYFSGPGFADGSKIGISVNLSGVTDTQSLAAAINTGIQNAANGNTPAAAAFKSANIVTSVHTDATGAQQLAFTSSTSAFQVQAGDQMSNALMGNLSTGATGASIKTSVTGQAINAGATMNTNDVVVKISGAGMATPVEITLTKGAAVTAGDMESSLETQVSANDTLKAAGISVTKNTDGQIVFTNSRNEQFSVEATGDTANSLGLGAFQASGGTADYTTIQGAGGAYATAVNDSSLNGEATLEFSINGAPAIALAGISLSGGNATQATQTSAAITNPVNIVTGVNDTLTFSVDGHAVTTTLAADGTAGAATAGTAKFNSGASDVVISAVSGAATASGVDLGATDVTVAGPANVMHISLDGGAAQTVTVAAHSYLQGNTGDGSADDIVKGVQDGLDAAFGAGKATASVDGSGNLVITSATKGAQSSVAVWDDATNPGLIGQLGLAEGTSVGSGFNTMMVSVDGGGPTQITVASGTYKAANNGDGGANDIVKAVQDGLDAQSLAATASVDATGKLVITSNTKGASSVVSIGDDPVNPGLISSLGMSAGSTFGTDGASDVDIANQVQAAIDQAKSATGGAGGTNGSLYGTGSSATVTVDSSHHIVITNDAKGADHTISAMSGNATTAGGGADWATGFTSVTGTNRTGADMADAINQQIAGNSTLKEAGLNASFSGGQLTITGTTSFRMNAGAAPANGTVTGTVDITQGADFTTSPMTLNVSVDGKVATVVTLNQKYSDAATLATAISSQLTAAGASAQAVSINGKEYLQIVSSAGPTHSVQVQSSGTANDALGLNDNAVKTGSNQVDIGFGVSNSSSTGSLALAKADSSLSVVNANGSSQTGAITFTALTNSGGKTQALTFAANNASGAMQSVTITLAATGAGTAALSNDGSGANIDQAVAYINSQLQKTNNPTLQNIVAVKQTVGGAEEINFLSSATSFQVGIGSAINKEGLNAGEAKTASGVVSGSGSTVSVLSQTDALAAVNAVASAITKLGSAQAAVGKGQNQLNYAVNLAQSQISNFSAAESRIRDADVAAEAANLTKAQVLQQASMAAMAQANSAPQAVLALLRG